MLAEQVTGPVMLLATGTKVRAPRVQPSWETRVSIWVSGCYEQAVHPAPSGGKRFEVGSTDAAETLINAFCKGPNCVLGFEAHSVSVHKQVSMAVCQQNCIYKNRQ